MPDFVLLDGAFYPADTKLFPASQLPELLFRDCLIVLKSQIPFWEDHLRLWALHFQLFKIKTPDFLQLEAKELRRQIERQLVKNKYFKEVRIRLSFFRQAENVSYLIETFPLDESFMKPQGNGFELELFKQIHKSDSEISALQLGSESIWKIAVASVNTDEILPVIQNANHCILETPGANIFLIKGKYVFTPHPSTGCYINPAKRTVAQAAQKLNMNFEEPDELYEEDLMDADEVFVANDLMGIQLIRGFGMKRYFRKQGQVIADTFNRLLIH